MEASAIKQTGVVGAHGRSPLLRLQSDERLVALVRRGNQHAFEALVARYQSRLLAFCRHMLSSREDAEDVLQEVFTAAFNAMLADNRPINVRPWLYRIARNRSLNHLRRVPAVGVDSMDTHFSEHGLSTAEKVHRREDFRLLITDVQDLPETQRTALLLREIDALSYEQIAEAMDNTVPSVKSLLVRARVGLAEASEARLLDCDAVRFELGEVAEGLKRMSSPVRRHLRSCERCASFKRQLAVTNRALAALLPVGPLFLLKKMVLAHLGTTAAASGGAAAGSAAAGGAIQVGLSAAATKAAAGLAAAAIVTAGAVEVRHVTDRAPRGGAITAAAPAAPPAAGTGDAASATSLLPRASSTGLSAGAAPAAVGPAGTGREQRAEDERRADQREKEPASAPADDESAGGDAAPAQAADTVATLPDPLKPTLPGTPSAGATLPLPPFTETVVQPSEGALGSPVTGVVTPRQGSQPPASPTPTLQPALQPPTVRDEPVASPPPDAPQPAPASGQGSGPSAPAPGPEPTVPAQGTTPADAEQPAPPPDAATDPEPAVEPAAAADPEPTVDAEPTPQPGPAPAPAP